jgi:hypothetical protein
MEEPDCVIHVTPGHHCDQCGRAAGLQHYYMTRGYCRGCCPSCGRVAQFRRMVF